MLGRVVRDPDGLEGAPGDTPGLGLLEIETTMTAEKRLAETQAVHAATGAAFSGYEIHIGQTAGPDCASPFAHVDRRGEGAVSADGRVAGSYLHGMFRDDGFRAAYLSALGAAPAEASYDETVERTLDALANHMEAHLDIAGLLGIAR